MPATERGNYLIADAWSLHGDALEMLSQGRLRNAAEKAWGATKRATDALVLERTGREPTRTSQTSSGLRALARLDAAADSLRSRLRGQVRSLHSDCFCDGDCEPENVIVGMIHGTADYIRDVEAAVDGSD